MSRSPRAGALLLLLVPAAGRAEAVLDVTGSVVSTAPRLEVRVVVSNRGDRPAAPLDVEGELFGERRSARLAGGVPPRGSGAVSLEFAYEVPRPGLHALTLLLEHPVEGPPDGAGNAPVDSERAWLLLALGANPGPAVRLAAEPLRIEVKGDLPVRVASADGAAHRVRLRALTARGLRSEGDGAVVEVPATGDATVRLPIVRAGPIEQAGAPRGRHAVLLVAETLDGELARTAVLAAPVSVAPDPAVLPRVRGVLLVLGLVLVALALAFEVPRWRGGRDGATLD